MLATIQAESRSIGALPVCLGPENPHRLVSLWDMIEILAGDISSVWPNLMNIGLGFYGAGHSVTQEEAAQVVKPIICLCRKLKWVDLASQGERLLARVDKGEAGEPMMVLAEDFREAITARLGAVNLIVVEDSLCRLFSNASHELCGGPLHGDLAISEEEVNLAGRALALGLPTASVSHAMRSVEAGLHILAAQTGVSFSGPIELQDWKNLTERIQSQVAKQEQMMVRGQVKTEHLKLLAQLLVPADGFRLAWRNHVAHAREKYEDAEARKVLGYVGDYLMRLSRAL